MLPSELQRTAAMEEANDRKKAKVLKLAMVGVGESFTILDLKSQFCVCFLLLLMGFLL